jgi:hypothetical protein
MSGQSLHACGCTVDTKRPCRCPPEPCKVCGLYAQRSPTWCCASSLRPGARAPGCRAARARYGTCGTVRRVRYGEASPLAWHTSCPNMPHHGRLTADALHGSRARDGQNEVPGQCQGRGGDYDGRLDHSLRGQPLPSLAAHPKPPECRAMAHRRAAVGPCAPSWTSGEARRRGRMGSARTSPLFMRLAALMNTVDP